MGLERVGWSGSAGGNDYFAAARRLAVVPVKGSKALRALDGARRAEAEEGNMRTEADSTCCSMARKARRALLTAAES